MPTQTEIIEPFVPEDQKPEVCCRLGCDMVLLSDSRKRMAPAFAHQSGGETRYLSIPYAWLNNVNRDVWANDIKPWLASLHEES